MLHTFAPKLAPSIGSLFNLSLKTGKLPDEWKNNVLIPKNLHIQDVQSYHPISFLSIISKTLECFVVLFTGFYWNIYLQTQSSLTISMVFSQVVPL